MGDPTFQGIARGGLAPLPHAGWASHPALRVDGNDYPAVHAVAS